jgi:hypothetical protein
MGRYKSSNKRVILRFEEAGSITATSRFNRGFRDSTVRKLMLLWKARVSSIVALI